MSAFPRKTLPLAVLLLLAVPGFAADKPPPPRNDSSGDPLPAGALARMGTLRWRHGGRVMALAFAPDGKSLASTSFDGTARLWDFGTGKELQRFSGHRGDVLCLALSPDGKLLATGGRDGSVRLWDPATGEQRRLLLDGRGRVLGLAFGPGSKRLAAGTDFDGVYVWDVRSGRQVLKLDTADSVSDLAFTPDGKHLAVSESHKGGNGGVELRRVSDGAVAIRFGEMLHDLALSPDGKTIAVATYEGTPAVYGLPGGKKLFDMKGDVADVDRIVMAYSPDGRFLASGSLDGTLRLWDARTGKQLRKSTARRRHVDAVAFSPDGKTLAVAGSHNRVELWDVETWKERKTPDGHRGAVHAVALSPDGRTLATVGADGYLRLWDAGTGKKTIRVEIPPGEVTAVAWSPDGRTVVTGNEFGHVHYFDAATGKNERRLQGHGQRVTALLFTPDGKGLISGGGDRAVRLWDPATGKMAAGFGDWRFARGVHRAGAGPVKKPRKPFRPAGGIAALALAPKGGSVLVADTGAALVLLDYHSGEELTRFEGHTGGGLAVAFSPTGRLAVSGGREPMLRFWEVVSGKQRKAFGGHPGWVHSVAWSPDGALIASGHGDGTLRFWDARTTKLVKELDAHRGPVESLSFSADGKRLASGSDDTTALVWDVHAVVRLARLEEVKLPEARVKALWRDLASEDAPRAGVALQTLARAPSRAVPFLKERIRPVTREELDRLMRGLDSPRFAKRSAATRRLAALGSFAEPSLRKLLDGRPSLEVRRRAERLLVQIGAEGRAAEELQALRGIELLEMIGTAEARKVLAVLAEGAAECALTVEAKAALKRLSKHKQ